jgi:hypothetical protein
VDVRRFRMPGLIAVAAIERRGILGHPVVRLRRFRCTALRSRVRRSAVLLASSSRRAARSGSGAVSGDVPAAHAAVSSLLLRKSR